MFELSSFTRKFYIVTQLCIIWSRCEVGNSKQAEIEVSSRLMSSLCAFHSKFQDDKQMASEPIKSVPQGLPVLDTKCDTWARTCGEDCHTWSFEKESKCKYKKDRGARIAGGEDAKLGDASWDIHLRCIYDWGSTQGNTKNFSKDEIVTNNVSRIKEGDRCTGVFYTKNVVITGGSCGVDGINFAKTRNRYVGWLARQRFLVQNWCILQSDVNSKQTCDITLHPEYMKNKTSKGKAKNTTEEFYPDSEHDISIVKFYTAFNFKSYSHTRAILFPQPGMEFEGKAIFAGWGATNDKASHNAPPEGRPEQVTKLQKIELTIIPYEPKCKAVIQKNLELGAGVFDPSYDYSQRFICAVAADETKQALCYGDNGGALVCDKDGKKYACGLKNQWGMIDCLTDPVRQGVEVFLKMSYYTPWIESVVGTQSESDLNP